MTENKIHYGNKAIRRLTQNIIRGITTDNWRPDYIVGLTRGGLIPATMISHYLNIPMHTLNVSLRDSDIGPESNLWMAEDAFGYSNELESRYDTAKIKNILVVDDINDSGATLNWIVDDWRKSCLPNNSRWSEVFGNNIRFAVLVNNEASDFKNISYSGTSINKLENPQWIVFPWEAWW